MALALENRPPALFGVRARGSAVGAPIFVGVRDEVLDVVVDRRGREGRVRQELGGDRVGVGRVESCRARHHLVHDLQAGAGVGQESAVGAEAAAGVVVGRRRTGSAPTSRSRTGGRRVRPSAGFRKLTGGQLREPTVERGAVDVLEAIEPLQVARPVGLVGQRRGVEIHLVRLVDVQAPRGDVRVWADRDRVQVPGGAQVPDVAVDDVALGDARSGS